jgi:DNA-binding winged helix-turn-helix (wHTH) protein
VVRFADSGFLGLNVDVSVPERKLARFGLFEADLKPRVLTKNGLRVRLQDQPFQVLALLLEHPGEIVTREEIREKLSSVDNYVESDDGLNTAVKNLRLALGNTADNPRFVKTVHRRGYRLSPLHLTHNQHVLTLAALVMTEELDHQYPSSTFVQKYWLPVIHAEGNCGDGRRAAAEFQEFVDHQVWCRIAHLQHWPRLGLAVPMLAARIL